MTIKDAIGYIAEGHSFWAVETAREVCEAFNLTLPKHLIEYYEGQADANPNNHPKGLFLKEDKPTSGVSSLPLSNYVKRQLGVESESYFGRGSQARANARAVAEHLKTAI